MESKIWTIRQQIAKYNPLSGHHWVEEGQILGYEVRGGFFQPTKHQTLNAAQAEKKKRDAFNARHPFEPPRAFHEEQHTKKYDTIK